MTPAAEWGWRDAQVGPHAGGLINQTFVVRDDAGEPIAALQRLHAIWAPEVNLDIDAVTSHLAARGMATPRLLRTRAGEPWVVYEGAVWRALSWLAGETVHAVPAPEWARAAGELVGRFHAAIADFRYDYRFTRAGVHDTAAHLAKLRERAAAGEGELVDLAREILNAADALPAMPHLPRRHLHGDLKISNVVFGREPLQARALIDLDTVGKGTLAFELGDALRSWCNPHGEDAGQAKFELPIFAAAIEGFFAAAAPVSADERVAIVTGLETVCLELAARFAIDAFDDHYFGWDPSRFPSRRAHNVVRAKGQLALGLSVRAQRDEALALLPR